jgi:hypothetical protein
LSVRRSDGFMAYNMNFSAEFILNSCEKFILVVGHGFL